MKLILKLRIWIVALSVLIVNGILKNAYPIFDVDYNYFLVFALLAILLTYLTGRFLQKKEKKKIDNAYLIINTVFLIAVVTALVNFSGNKKDLTYSYTDTKTLLIKGTPDSLLIKAKFDPSYKDEAELVASHGGPVYNSSLWESNSYTAARKAIIYSYLFLIVAIAMLFGFLLEMILYRRKPWNLKNLIDLSVSNYDNYIKIYHEKKRNPRYSKVKYNVFISYANEQRSIAECLYYKLINLNHIVFYDRKTLPAAGNFETQIQQAVACSDRMIFLISPDSVKKDCYTHLELKYAEIKWPAPAGKLLSVEVIPTSIDDVPAYVKSLNFLDTSADKCVETSLAVEAMYQQDKNMRLVN